MSLKQVRGTDRFVDADIQALEIWKFKKFYSAIQKHQKI